MCSTLARRNAYLKPAIRELSEVSGLWCECCLVDFELKAIAGNFEVAVLASGKDVHDDSVGWTLLQQNSY